MTQNAVRSCLGLATALVTLVAISHAQAPVQDWPQWRGARRTGEVTGSQAPAAWPATWQSRWRAEVGEGYSSPVYAGGRIFVHSRRDPQEVVMALDATTGKPVWEKTYDAAFTKNQYANRMAKGPNATPLVSDGKLFTVGVTGVVTAWDVLALDPGTGVAKWTWTGAGPGYASPMLVDIAGTSQLVTMTNSSVVGVNARTGAALWSVPFPDEWHENIVTPVWTGTHLIVSGTRQGTHAYTVTRTGETWSAVQAWKNADVAMYMSSPVLADGTLFGLSSKRKGQFVALDAKTGTLRWGSEGRNADHASVLFTATHVVYLTSTGELMLLKRGASGFTAERQYEVAKSATYAPPLFVDGDLLVRDATGVTRLKGA